jgi:peptidoglycan/xylan/chitin deacetylase (PgdA/CDA1 family)
VLGIGRLRQWGRRCALRFRAHGVILLYHRVADLESDPQLLSVTPAHFREHLEVIRRRSLPAISLPALVREMAAGRPPDRFVVLTFDDGYADILADAKRLLSAAGVPATVFVSTGYLDGGREFWWDELERLLLASDGDAKTGGSVPREIAPGSRRERYRDFWGKLRGLSEAERSKALEALRRESGAGSQVRASYRTMTAGEVRSLAEDGLVGIGAHGVSHSLLSALSPAEQRDEIAGSKARLEGILGTPVTGFSYPFGGRGEYGRETVRLVQEAGFNCACANYPDVVTTGSGRFELPRCLVQDWDGEEFARRLDGWLRG